jgi:radical SAM superfamily enzyme with C-terminal helix-hairpin-helix motif
MRALLLDGYTDEPACLGVPPFISPNARSMYGALVSGGADVRYATIDQWRAGEVHVDRYQLLAVVRNVAVPGKYLRGMPASDRELALIGGSFRGTSVLSASDRMVRGDVREAFDHVASLDPDAGLFDLLASGGFSDRRRTREEWNRWLALGARACSEHPDHGGMLIAEVQMYRGCVRFASGGCRFCVEPLLGEVVSRTPGEIVAEAEALATAGVRNIRLGAQSCVYSYMAKGIGESDTPMPDPDAVEAVLRGVRESVDPEVFHLDNANPAILASHPEEARRITASIVKHCSSGNVLAFGLESADPEVARENNLNATPEQTMAAIRIVNELGAAVGGSGLPAVLPGVNLLCGLHGETKHSYEVNLAFLRSVLDEGLLLRRINIRQVLPVRDEFPGVRNRGDFSRFKRAVREHVDLPMLERIFPDGTVLTGVHAELREGGRTFGRQVGTYPILVGIPYPVELGRRVDVAVTGRGYRSLTGILHPTDANRATMSMLEAVPGIGRRRAMAIVRRRPFARPEELRALFDEEGARELAMFHLACGDVGQQ